jgi:hypothetical protein
MRHYFNFFLSFITNLRLAWGLPLKCHSFGFTSIYFQVRLIYYFLRLVIGYLQVTLRVAKNYLIIHKDNSNLVLSTNLYRYNCNTSPMINGFLYVYAEQSWRRRPRLFYALIYYLCVSANPCSIACNYLSILLQA